jgi:hypothetical protein
MPNLASRNKLSILTSALLRLNTLTTTTTRLQTDVDVYILPVSDLSYRGRNLAFHIEYLSTIEVNARLHVFTDESEFILPSRPRAKY